MHGVAIGIGTGLGVSPGVTLANLMTAAFFFGCARYGCGVAAPVRDDTMGHGSPASQPSRPPIFRAAEQLRACRPGMVPHRYVKKTTGVMVR
jgi:hypothetical protein